METTIPFSGFYYSIHDQGLDSSLELLFSDDHGHVNKTLFDKAFNSMDWANVHLEYAKKYMELLADKFGLKTLKFKLLSSPRYYNFETDRIICEIDLDEIKEIWSKVSTDKLRERIHERFTSYDGFISHYPNDLDRWPEDQADWDLNQIGTLIEVYIAEHDSYDAESFEFDIYEDLSDFCYSLLCDNIEDPKVFKVWDYLRKRQDRKVA